MTQKGLVKAVNNFIKVQSDLIDEFNETGNDFDVLVEPIIHTISPYLTTYRYIDVQGMLIRCIIAAMEGDDLVETLSHELRNLQYDEYDSSLNMYFRDLGRQYKKSHEERTQMILDNTKMVISVAQKYTGLGLPLEDLISAGNVGLITAWEKYDPKKMNLKDNLLELLEENEAEVLKDHITYGPMRDKLDKFLEIERTKEEACEWVNKNVKNAKFSSVCMVWIRSFILMEIDAYSRTVKKPKQDIYNDRSESGGYIKEITKDIFEVKGNDGTVFGDTVCGGSEDSELNSIEAYNEYKMSLLRLFDGMNFRSRNIVMKKFGLGLPRPLTPKEIAEQEGLTVARVSQIFSQAMELMRDNAKKYDIDATYMYSLCSEM